MSTPSLLSEQIRAERACRARCGGEDEPHERHNSQATPPSRKPLQPGATTPLKRDGALLKPVISRPQSSTDFSNAIGTLRRASTAPEQTQGFQGPPSELLLKAQSLTRNADSVLRLESQTADLSFAMVHGR